MELKKILCICVTFRGSDPEGLARHVVRSSRESIRTSDENYFGLPEMDSAHIPWRISGFVNSKAIYI